MNRNLKAALVAATIAVAAPAIKGSESMDFSIAPVFGMTQ